MEFLNKFDRQKLQRITLIVIAALTLLALILLLVIIIGSVEGDSKPNNIDGPALDNLKEMDFESATVTESQLNKGSLILANEEHSYTAPSDLNLVNIAAYRNERDTSVPYSVGDIWKFHLAADAMKNAHNMLITLKNDTGNDNITIDAAYGKEDYSKDIHTGYTMVLTVYGGTYLNDEANADLLNWLTSNAHKYGFVVRYPENKSEITKVSEYTYAYRYVGVAHATYMKENDLCLEEYIDYLKDETSHKDLLTFTGADGVSYAVYFAEAEADGDSIKVPVQTPNPDGSTSYAYTVSGTNAGGVVVTVRLD